MPAVFEYLIAAIGGSSIAIALLAFFGRTLLAQLLSKELEDHKNHLAQELASHTATLSRENAEVAAKTQAAWQTELESHKAALARQVAAAAEDAKFEFEKELILRRSEAEIARDQFRLDAETDKEFRDRIRAQVRRWALPVQAATKDLSRHLAYLLNGGGHKMLSSSTSAPGWSETHEHCMACSLYYFAQYFCWTRSLHRELDTELFPASADVKALFVSVNAASKALSEYPHPSKPIDTLLKTDRQVFALQQQALGELLLIDGSVSGDQVMTYRQFLHARLNDDDRVRRICLGPMEDFLRDLKAENDVRWLRLTEMKSKLDEVTAVSKSILRIPTLEDENVAVGNTTTPESAA